MSTRCNIIIKGSGFDAITLYHHCDGYPAGVGAILKAFCEKINNSWYIENDDLATHLVKHGVYIFNKKTKVQETDDGYEISNFLHGDIEYLYIVYCRPYASHNGKRYDVVGYEKVYSYQGGYRKIDIPELDKDLSIKID